MVPSLTFKPIYCFVVLSHDRRRILHVNVTQHPTDEWTAQQIVEAFPGDEQMPRYLHRSHLLASESERLLHNALFHRLHILGLPHS